MTVRISAGCLFLLIQVQILLYAGHSTASGTNGKFARISRETPSGGCRLPEQPQNGEYISPQCLPGDQKTECANAAGTAVPSNWLLKYSCHGNYTLNSDVEYSVCENGIWKNPLNCIKSCPPLESLNVDLQCSHGGREVSCSESMKPNTTVMGKCKPNYREIYRREYSSIRCLDSGEWSYRLFDCAPECGYTAGSTPLVPLILNGKDTDRGEHPWVAGLYHQRDGGRWEMRCTGTLVSPHIVLTAAHCAMDYSGHLAPPGSLKVGLGKYYSDFYREEESSVISDVREIVVPSFYTGMSTFFAQDIAILDLATSVRVTAYVMPACVDWTLSETNAAGTVGQVASWGVTENGTLNDKLLSAELRAVGNTDCRGKLPVIFARMLTQDKFCSESKNGGEIGKLDSGAGLTYLVNGQHFLVGLASTKLPQNNSYTLFTNITNREHLAWLQEARTRLDQLHNEA
uniref:Peptidase S1 domain-containing protein n=1 Tax=Graphocephala atropunctata TaxID=36148 RepID=A0A1B6KI93_9HEMI